MFEDENEWDEKNYFKIFFLFFLFGSFNKKNENTILLYGSLGERKWDVYEGTLIPHNLFSQLPYIFTLKTSYSNPCQK